MYNTPLAVEVNVSFEEYIKSLSRKARKNYSYVKKHNSDLVYKEIPFDRELIDNFMELWERQLIRGQRVQCAFRGGFVEDLAREGIMKIFVASKETEVIAVHFVEKYNDYIECHPQMYDKVKYRDRYMAKFMWFSIIEWATKTDVTWVDLGGGGRGTWKEFCISRLEHEKPRNKWTYIPREVKNNPELQPDTYVFKCPVCKYKFISLKPSCKNCNTDFKE